MYGELPKIKLLNSDDEISGFPVMIESSPTGPKTCVLRLPTDGEILDYLRAQRSLYRDLGRRKGKAEEVPNPKADAKLFRAVRLDAGPDFDEHETAYALRRLTQNRVTQCERSASQYTVSLLTPFGECTHTVRIPYESERYEYSRSFVDTTDLPHGVEERRFPPEVAVRLYDKVVQGIEGYAGSGEPAAIVPPHHKRSVVNELMSTLVSLEGGDTDPN